MGFWYKRLLVHSQAMSGVFISAHFNLIYSRREKYGTSVYYFRLFDMRQSSLAETSEDWLFSRSKEDHGDIFLEFIRLQSLETWTLGFDDEFLARILEAGELLSLLDFFPSRGAFFS